MGHVRDTWYRTVIGAATGKHTREKTRLHGKGQRYRVRTSIRRVPSGARVSPTARRRRLMIFGSSLYQVGLVIK
jgi:hypothetical protein